MRIALLQHDIEWKQPGANLQRLERLMDDCPGADLYVLPEMFATGFVVQPDEVAEPENGTVQQWMISRAAETGAALAGSVAVETDGHFRNRFFFAEPSGRVTAYDKRHLFTYGGEDRQYECGTERVVVNFRGVRFLLQTCFDLRFPVWSRNRDDYDVILYVANWPASRVLAWDTLLRARAIENQCYVAGVNRTGLDPTLEYCGHSVVIHPYGHELASAPADREAVVTAELDMEKLHDFRQKFPVMKEADRFVIDRLKG